MLNSHPDVVFHLNEIPIIKCLSCQGSMPHQHTSKLGERYEKRSYVCHKCQITERFYFDLRPLQAKRA